MLFIRHSAKNGGRLGMRGEAKKNDFSLGRNARVEPELTEPPRSSKRYLESIRRRTE
jgi:hypothetical protein